MFELALRHQFLHQLGVQAWYPRGRLAGASKSAPVYVWSVTGEGGAAQKVVATDPRPGAGKRPVQGLGQLIESLHGDTQSQSETGREPKAESEPVQRLKADIPSGPEIGDTLARAQAPRKQSIVSDQDQPSSTSRYLAVVTAGAWQFYIEASSESDLAIELEAARKIVDGIRTLPGWAAPQINSFVWPPLGGGLCEAPPGKWVHRFLQEVAVPGIRYVIVASSCPPEGIWKDARKLRVEGAGLSWLLSDRQRKRQFWTSLKALCQ